MLDDEDDVKSCLHTEKEGNPCKKPLISKHDLELRGQFQKTGDDPGGQGNTESFKSEI